MTMKQHCQGNFPELQMTENILIGIRSHGLIYRSHPICAARSFLLFTRRAQGVLKDSRERSGKRRRQVIPFVKYYLPMRSRLTLSVRTDELCQIEILRASVDRRRLFSSPHIFGQTHGAFELAPFRIEPAGPRGL